MKVKHYKCKSKKSTKLVSLRRRTDHQTAHKQVEGFIKLYTFVEEHFSSQKFNNLISTYQKTSSVTLQECPEVWILSTTGSRAQSGLASWSTDPDCPLMTRRGHRSAQHTMCTMS